MRADRRSQEDRLFDSVREYYSTPEAIEHYADRSVELGLAPPERAMVERFMKPPASVLDVGCGAGREAFELARIGFAVTGVDIAPALLGRGVALAAKLGLDVDFRLGDGRTLAFPDATFDYVMLITQMIHYVPMRANRVGLLREAGRVVKPSGRILLTYHDWEIVKNHRPWGCGRRTDAERADEVAASFGVLEPCDGFCRDCQGVPAGVFGYEHSFTRPEMEAEVRQAGLAIADRAQFHTIAGGEPDEFWKPTQVLVLARPRGGPREPDQKKPHS